MFINDYKDYKNLLNKAFREMIKRSFVIKNSDVLANFDQNCKRSADYYSYRKSSFSQVIEHLRLSHVTLIGCGGVGSNLAHILGLSGVGSLSLIDPDFVEISNLSRAPLFSKDHLGMHKVDVIKSQLQKRTDMLKINTSKQKIKSYDDLNLLQNCDLIVLSADSPRQLYKWLNRYCVNNRQSFITAGYINDIAVFGPLFIPGLSSCAECNEIVSTHSKSDDYYSTINQINLRFRTASYPPVNCIAASYAAHEILMYLGRFGKLHSVSKRIGIHSTNLKFETIDIPKNQRCSLCANI